MKELRKYISFDSVAEMDKTIDFTLKEYNLKDSERVILLKLSNYSCKFVGVSYLKNNTLADLTGYSKRTVQRALKRFSELGIITRIEQFKPVKGGYSAFICVINPFERHHELASCKEATEPTPEQLDEPSHENEAITTKTKTLNNKPYVTPELDINHLDAIGVPTQFSTAALPYLDVQAVYKLWSKVQMAAKKHAPDLVDTVEIAVSSVRASVLANKVKRVRDFTGYFYGVLAQKLSTAQRSLKCKLFNFLQ
ncbi:helix-turn-helix domain-containing protein [Bacillus mycoides]|uniref:helix-turn-helix domain-containing protein n=1 Tax=Bacillus mycoides TaxID=1405 RepID=UPI002570F267|nr:helix-turn-helix domain-containing protein [Bacillus mycoides]MDM5426723.1 helix-turn-helix domain-containing protein [Bacillus mycoides]MED1012595.1 helix-turn-helix domain-containing protein [Bacillus mycoides]MED1052638.1 helix-turn-helix domain-containing protein [Bacillus mycoides]WJE65602.1 helix-turn-helix domain-containing protein [Bacillus mycoides]